MQFPPEFVLSKSLKVGVVYKMKAPELIETSIWHYFVVVAQCDDDSYLIVSTTQLENRMEYLNKRGYDLDTLAYISPNSDNGLTKDSYFDCNSYHTLSKDNLISKIEESELCIEGQFSEEEYSKIIDAIKLSTVNDIPRFLLKYI